MPLYRNGESRLWQSRDFDRAQQSVYASGKSRPAGARDEGNLIDAPKAGNRVLVSHGATISALAGVSLDTAEMLVVTPQPRGGFVVQGRLSVPQ